MTQKENALLLFHLMGKIMYNKRLFASIFPRAMNLDAKSTQGKVIVLPCLLLQETSHEIVSSIGR